MTCLFKIKKYLWLLASLVLVTSCLGKVDKVGSVIGYQNGLVLTEGGRFRVGVLPATWVKKDFSYRNVLFSHQQTGNSISVSSFCGSSFDDGPLSLLSKQLFYGVEKPTVISESQLTMDGREALRRVIEGFMDGSPVKLDGVVLKMNECVFDFLLVSSKQDYSVVLPDFNHLLEGFQYVVGPQIGGR